MEYGCIGEKLGHSFSCDIHSRLARYDYELCELRREELGRFLQRRDFKGINVTIPYKTDVMEYLDVIDGNAARIGAVNTIVNRDGRLYGYNTDFYGLSALISRVGADVEGRKALILGSGGTSRTARAVLESLGAGEITVASRSGKPVTVSYDEVLRCHSDAELVINTTPLGMYPNTEGAAIDLGTFGNLRFAIDAVYNPLRTTFVQRAQSLGARAEGGLYMLVSQAVASSNIFTGEKSENGIVDRIYADILREKSNIVLCGMPGAGKTTVGRMIAGRLGREFIDTDELILKTTGRTPEAIIREDGEERFRDIETNIIKNVSKDTHNSVISLGGGAVLRKENVISMRHNGFAFFLDRAIGSLTPDASRPLSDTEEKMKKIYAERYPIYVGSADAVTDAEFSAESAADRVIEKYEELIC